MVIMRQSGFEKFTSSFTGGLLPEASSIIGSRRSGEADPQSRFKVFRVPPDPVPQGVQNFAAFPGIMR